MKKINILLLLILSVLVSSAQSVNIDARPKVATKGYAEKEVTPDIVYLSIGIKEFYLNGNVKKKVFIETLEKQLFDAAIAAGVKKEDLTIQNIYSYNYDNKKKNNELLQARQYRIKVTNLNNLNTMMEKIDPQGLQSMTIDGYDHSKKREIESQLKTEAVQNARKNAEILASADGQTVGKALIINDNSNFDFNNYVSYPSPMYKRDMAVMATGAENSTESLNIDIKPIKLTCHIDCVYELK